MELNSLLTDSENFNIYISKIFSYLLDVGFSDLEMIDIQKMLNLLQNNDLKILKNTLNFTNSLIQTIVADDNKDYTLKLLDLNLLHHLYSMFDLEIPYIIKLLIVKTISNLLFLTPNDIIINLSTDNIIISLCEFLGSVDTIEDLQPFVVFFHYLLRLNSNDIFNAIKNHLSIDNLLQLKSTSSDSMTSFHIVSIINQISE